MSNKGPVPHAVVDTIIGMFLVLDSTDHEHYRMGQIVGAVGDCYLIQFAKLETDQPIPPMELHTLKELSAICQNCDQKLANLFKSRDDMMVWINGIGYTNRSSPLRAPATFSQVISGGAFNKPRLSKQAL